jgi:DNA end-binding protein Ku
MRTIVHGVINFGMVAIPVGVCGVRSTKLEPKFTTLHQCGTPIKQDKHCPSCESEVFPELLMKGYEITKGEFLVFTQDEIASVSSDRDKTIDLSKFVKANEITPERVKAVYWLSPPENPELAEKYGLLYQSLAESKKIGIGVESLWGKQAPCAVVPVTADGRGLQLWVLHLDQDMIPLDFDVPVPGREEKKLAKVLIEAQSAEFDPAKDLETSERKRVHALIAARLENEDLPVFGSPKETQDEVDLMGALRESVAGVEARKKVKA